MQKLEISTCGPCQLYFFDNVFNPDENSSIQKHSKLTKKAIGNNYTRPRGKQKKNNTVHWTNEHKTSMNKVTLV